MKKTLLLSAIVFLSSQTFAAGSSKAKPKESRMAVCEKLQEQAIDNCTEYLCKKIADAAKDSGLEPRECSSYMDGDFAEAQHMCVYDHELPSLIKDYNKKTGKNLNCDDL